MKYNHMFDVAFAVETEEEDTDNISKEEMLAALLKRVAQLFVSYEPEAIGFCDTYEVEEYG
jgi:hypothetical protein